MFYYYHKCHSYFSWVIGISFLPNEVREIKYRRFRWVGHVARLEQDRSAFKILTGTPVGKRPIGMPRHNRRKRSSYKI